MKKIILSLAIVALITSCSNNNAASKEGDKKEATDENPNESNPDYKKGLALIAKSDCLTCHKVDDPLTGPPYRKVAEKYAGMSDTVVSYLADKIVAGGKGNWGEVPMIPHPGISKEDAEAMVKYILLLKK